ncbi:MAG: DSD1 family PLP-dependent enzyme [Comamonadaceae bacterium]|jgi:D-serine deaminase-like pyridoxal phosphate-dependent protein|uniref:DSD1 family PLP-dependent enzyme n=1 Tax=Hydrogenophaga borbori TaxID=2294117 RepID=A0A372EJU0_9BURK|nr:DSD1 family PLP-dependent enzyme [Hydrogenophaga borbori]NCT98006.1 DSD1 family PLP-dependent enzyme [Comamonadaceae bacterium]RFP79202.1 DSD1 family PLP-dependent enzyme [Hydrogenophaga borbori]
MSAAPERFLGLVGQGVAAIDTPALVIDLDAMERNLHRLADWCRARGLRLRPHAKMHKCAELAKLQMAHGAVGVCVQKTGEALALAAAGVTDITITNEVVDPTKLARLARAVRAGGTRFALAVDSALGIERLAHALAEAGVRAPGAIDVLVEIDVGHGRCGAAPGEPAVALARAVASHAALRFAGLQAYHGAAQHQRTPEQRRATVARAAEAVARTRALIEGAGLAVPLVTGAGTGTFVHEAASGQWGELQAGSYLFMDADYAANTADENAPGFEHALFVKAQVMSRPEGRAVVDAGHKSHAIDSGLPRVWLPEGLAFANGGDEHGVLHGPALPALGETVWLVPGHCDPTVNLHDHLIGVRGGLLTGRVERVLRVDARGALD